MAKMRITPRAKHLYAMHAVSEILLFSQGIIRDRLVKTRPAAA
jgi:hypothetical protein